MSSNPLPTYLLPDCASSSPSGALKIGGILLEDLAEEFGTPLFVYDQEHIEQRCNEAVSSWGPGVAYATKAFLCKEMARLAYEMGMDLDVSTAGELYVALQAGVQGSAIVLHGNNKSDEELKLALDNSVGKIVIDSFDEIERLRNLSRKCRVMIRVTPGIEAHTHEFVQTGQDDSKFGFGLKSQSAQKAVKLVEQISHLDLVGIHVHIGSQIFAESSYALALETVADFAKSLDIGEICIGGGLGVAYVEGEVAPSITSWAQSVRDSANRVGIAPDVKLTAEPGRSIVAQAGITLYSVGTIKDVSDSKTFVSVDGGMSDNPRPVLYGSGYEVFLPREYMVVRDKVVDVVGKHCESGDFIVKGANIPADIKVGDILATPVSGAYGYSMASNYNKVPRPAVVFVRQGDARLVARRETLEDLIRLDE